MRVTKAALTVCWFVLSAGAFAQSPEKEAAAIMEVGGAGNWNVKGGGSAFGPTVAVEVTPIKNWLEIEAGVTPLFTKGSTEWDSDLLFKKPWDISKKIRGTVPSVQCQTTSKRSRLPEPRNHGKPTSTKATQLKSNTR